MKRTLLSVIAILALTTVSFAQLWAPQNTGFTAPSRGITDMYAVDANVLWAVAYDGTDPTAPCQDFTRTTNGGATWTPGTIAGISALSIAMIEAASDQIAWAVAYPPASTTTGQGIWKTTNSGTTWTRQTTAAFSNSASFANCVHFYNENDGWCMGDPINGDFEIYTTADGGTTWTIVPGGQIANPVSGEFGVIGYTSSVGDTSWFGTNKGRIYKSIDKGHNWTAAAISGWSSKYCTPVFKDGMNGLAQDRGSTTTGLLAETSDGGATWTVITGSTSFTNDLRYVPGTPNTYVATGADVDNGAAGVMYSFDGGHDWTTMPETEGVQYLAEAWVDSEHGWAGAFSEDATTGGMFVFTGNLIQAVPDFFTADTLLAFAGTATFTNLSTGADSYLWTFQGGTPSSSNLETPPPIQYLAGGTFNVSLTVSNDFTTSATETKTGYIHVGGVGVNDKNAPVVTVFPNPATEFVTINGNAKIQEVVFYNLVGQIVYKTTVNNNSASVNVNGITPGVYNVKVTLENGSFNSKIVVK